ncbi:MAG: gamma carbonic anhydrase family protein [Thermodesulfobacteriota bacterium]|nr:gamma carbonic anhydrase family protein [Thermodesulfobacteriota bacterium]
MPLYAFRDKRPVVDDGAWIAPSAVIIGDVRIGPRCWIGPGAVIRADFGPIRIGEETAIEDGVVIHCADRVEIGKGVIIGHMAMIHGCRIGDSCVIGMHSTVCDKAVTGPWSIVAEHSLVKKGQVIGEGVFGGVPAAFKYAIEQRHKDYLELGVQMYVSLSAGYAEGLKEILG